MKKSTKSREKKCDTCASSRLFGLFSKACDGNYYKLAGDRSWSDRGYAPSVSHVSEGDGANFTVCLECGKIQGKFPVEDPDEGC